MKKNNLFAVAALVVLPSIFVSSTGFSASQLPPISSSGATQQQTCPSGSQFGCFFAGIQQAGANGAINTGFSNMASAQYAPFKPCLQFINTLLRLGTEPGQPSA